MLYIITLFNIFAVLWSKYKYGIYIANEIQRG